MPDASSMGMTCQAPLLLLAQSRAGLHGLIPQDLTHLCSPPEMLCASEEQVQFPGTGRAQGMLPPSLSLSSYQLQPISS